MKAWLILAIVLVVFAVQGLAACSTEPNKLLEFNSRLISNEKGQFAKDLTPTARSEMMALLKQTSSGVSLAFEIAQDLRTLEQSMLKADIELEEGAYAEPVLNLKEMESLFDNILEGPLQNEQPVQIAIDSQPGADFTSDISIKILSLANSGERVLEMPEIKFPSDEDFKIIYGGSI